MLHKLPRFQERKHKIFLATEKRINPEMCFAYGETRHPRLAAIDIDGSVLAGMIGVEKTIDQCYRIARGHSRNVRQRRRMLFRENPRMHWAYPGYALRAGLPTRRNTTMKKILIAALLLLIAPHASATSFTEVGFDELVEQSELVLVGRIVSGRSLADECGVEVTIRVAESIKGHLKKDDTVTTSIASELSEIGVERVFFVSKRPDQVSGMVSTNSRDMKLRQDVWDRCKSIYPLYAVNLDEWAAPESLKTYTKGLNEVVSINDYMMMPPADLPKHKEDRSATYRLEDGIERVWIERGTFIEYLRRIAAKAHAANP